MSQYGASPRVASESLVSRICAWLFESLAAYGASEAGVLIGEEAAVGEHWVAWAGDSTTLRVPRPRLYDRQLRYRRATWRHPNGR